MTSTAIGSAIPLAALRTARRTPPAPIPLSRMVSVELRKSFDTRSGFWLLASIGLASLVATGVVVLVAPVDLAYSTFSLAVGFPMAVVLPMIAILSVTSEWSQRSGLTTFTLVPHRGRVILAKGIVALGVAVGSMVLAFAVGVFGNLAGSAIAGTSAVWDQNPLELGQVVLANTLVLVVGFTLGVLIRSSAGAIVAYFVYAFVMPPLLDLLAASQAWFADLRAWVDPSVTQHQLFHGLHTGEEWAQLGVTSVVWLAIPLTVGLWTLLRSEVK